MSEPTRIPAALNGRRLSSRERTLIALLYAAKQKTVRREVIAEALEFSAADDPSISNLIGQARRSMQATGWVISTVHGQGYRMIWNSKPDPDEAPDLGDAIKMIVEDQRAVRADLAMIHDAMMTALGELTSIPAHMLVPLSTWTASLDEEIRATKGIVGKLRILAEAVGVDGDAVVSRYRHLKSED